MLELGIKVFHAMDHEVLTTIVAAIAVHGAHRAIAAKRKAMAKAKRSHAARKGHQTRKAKRNAH